MAIQFLQPRGRGRWLAAILAAGLLAAIAISFTVMRSVERPTYTKADITIYLFDQPGMPSRAVTIDDPEQIDRLAAFFPGLDRGRRSNWAGAWVTPVTIRLTRPDGSTHSLDTDYEHWREGRGDHYARPGLREFVQELLSSAGPAGRPDHLVSRVAAHEREVPDVQAWFERRFPPEVYGQPTLTTHERDLDGDGVPDLLIETTAGAALAGRPHLLLRRTESGYVFLGEVFTYPDTIRVLPPTTDGRVRLVIYSRLSKRDGHVEWLVQHPKGFAAWYREPVWIGDDGDEETDGQRRLRQVFGPDVSDEDVAAMMPPPLRPGERVEIRISDLVGIGVDSVSRPRISEEGMVKVPLLDEEVKIGGLTERQAERAIVEKYRAARVIQNAQVTVRRVAEEDQADPDNAGVPAEEAPRRVASARRERVGAARRGRDQSPQFPPPHPLPHGRRRTGVRRLQSLLTGDGFVMDTALKTRQSFCGMGFQPMLHGLKARATEIKVEVTST